MEELIVKPVVSIAADVHCRLERMIALAEALISSLFIEDKFGVRIGDTESNAKNFYVLQQLVGLIQRHQ